MSITPTNQPRRVAIIGAGMVGLATGWYLQEQGVEVTVIDRVGPAAGSSWGNAGWLTPGITTPLPEPAILRSGFKALVSPNSPVYVPPTTDRRLITFLLGFARHSTTRRWQRAMGAYIPLNRRSFEAYDDLVAGGVESPVRDAEQFIAAYRTAEERKDLLEEIAHINAAGQPIEYDLLTGEEARAAEPSLSGEIGAALRLRGQRFINPGEFVHALADSFVARGGQLLTGSDVENVEDDGKGVRVITGGSDGARGATLVYDAAVLATGTWLNRLAKPFGVRKIVQAGRGYSFSIPVDHLPDGPVYFPAQRVACTPLQGEGGGTGRLRVAGMMEFRPADAPLDRRRIKAITEAARPMLTGVDLDSRQDEWVGSRPCTADGLPLIGATRSPRVFIGGGHGMWGVTLGPITGKLLAERITKGEPTTDLSAFNPLR